MKKQFLQAKQLALGSLYAGMVTVDGNLYMWGYGGHGNLGIGNRRSVGVPTLVKLLSGKNVRSVHCAVGQINPAIGGDVIGKEVFFYRDTALKD